MTSRGRLLLIETVHVPGQPDARIAGLDMARMIFRGEARQRTGEEYEELFAATGFGPVRVVRGQLDRSGLIHQESNSRYKPGTGGCIKPQCCHRPRWLCPTDVWRCCSRYCGLVSTDNMEEQMLDALPKCIRFSDNELRDGTGGAFGMEWRHGI